MAIAGMVVAQLLFGPDDRVWHVLSEYWRPGVKRRMHLAPNEKMWLVNVPVLRWTDSVALLHSIADLGDPMEAIRRYEELVRSERMRRRQEFVRRWLTRAEAEVVRLACAGLDNATIARRLRKSERTVANQLTSVYAKLSDWLGSPLRQSDRSVLIAELAPYYALSEAGIENVVPTRV
jgi:CRISPR-associated protein Csx14